MGAPHRARLTPNAFPERTHRQLVKVLGVDARGRAPFWTASLRDGQLEGLEAFDDLPEALAAPADVETIAVDVPLGHEDPEGEDEGLRACDRAAFELLGEARDRYFALPPPAVFAADTYHDALATCRDRDWPHLEAPLWFARERLAALNRLAGEDERLVEVHPEVSFTHMGDEQMPAEHYGDSWAALHERLQLLHVEGLRPETVEPDEGEPRAALDACAAAWSAHRTAAGRARRLPTDPPVDPRTNREVVLHA